MVHQSVIAFMGIAILNSSLTFSQTKAAPTLATRTSVEAILGKGKRPLAQADVKALGPNVDLVLIDIVHDSHADMALRSRAIDALAASGSAVARDQLVRIVTPTQSEVELPLVRKALLGLGWLHDARTVANASHWLSHASAPVRLDAAAALSLCNHPEAIEILERHNHREKDRDVRQKIERLIAHSHAVRPPVRRHHKPRLPPPQPMEGRDSHRF